MPKKIKILWKHPNLRDYRIPLLEGLNKIYSIHFLFTRSSEWDKQFSHTIIGKGKKSVSNELKTLKFLLFRILKDDYDVFIVSFIGTLFTIILAWIAKLRNKKVIVWEEQWLPGKSVKAKLTDFIIRHLLIKNIDAFFVTGAYQENYLISLGASPETIFNAPESSTDIKQFNPKKIDLGIPTLENYEIVLFLGRIIEIKGVNYLIEAFSEIEKVIKNAFLLIVGDGDQKQDCIDLAEQLRLGNFKFVDAITGSNIKSYFFNIAKVVVVPSIVTDGGAVEGGPIVIAEALSAGKPVVVSDAVGSSMDVIKDNVNGRIAKQKDYDDLAQKIMSILRASETEYKNLCTSARNTYETDCTYSNMIRVFSKCIESKPPRAQRRRKGH